MQKKKGISLIVLVITIIVMIILAGAIILSLNNSGIIDKASEAVEDTDKATLEDIASLAWADVYAENEMKKDKLTGQALLDALKQGIKNALSENNLNPDEYGITVTEKGFKIAKGWVQDGLIVTKGDTILNVGDDIAYDETLDKTIEVPEDVEWKILGASDEGELLILSKEMVGVYSISSGFEERKDAWLTAPGELDSLCKLYGNGKNATGARSIRIEDIDKVTGFDKTTYGKGEIYEYGNEVTYSYDGSKIMYTSTNNKSGTLTEDHSNGFNYYKGTDFVTANLNTTLGIIITIKNNAYKYDLSHLIDSTSEAYKMFIRRLLACLSLCGE